MGLFTKLFGTQSEREIKKILPLANRVFALEKPYQALSDDELKAKTAELRTRLANGETEDDILPEAFATVREASARVLGMRHFDCQILGGIILHQGRIAEMKTGEGKTLVATLPCYLNALSGKGVHVVTVNDYLAQRDSEWMGKIYRFLGLTVGLVIHGGTDEEKRAAYAADITYGTNNEFGFDYLRDNMVVHKERMTQRGHHYAIIDEVDSILIDEARTPLIISGQGEKSDEMYERANRFVRSLTDLKVKEMESKEEYGEADADYVVEEKDKNAILTARGIEKAQKFFGVENLADPENVALQHYINQAMKAIGTMRRDIDYVVKDGQVIIVDEFTGRLMFGRRYSNGLHQAIEAKEGVKIENENKTLATITFQNLFRIYEKLAGMTGTALTEEKEFEEIYGLDVVEIPTNKPMVRKDLNDVVYKTEAGKFNAVVQKITEKHAKGQPLLVGTITIEKSELLSRMLKRAGIPHNVLNAKNHEREAAIIAQAGKKGAVTIATNMAGRGTDIILGGNAEYMAKAQMEKEGIEHEYIVQATGFADTEDENILAARARFKELYAAYKEEYAKEAEEVKAAGGLCILGTERHESRRIDNQLRGRAGRQGDVGETRFYLSLEDDLMRLFGGERVSAIAEMFNLPEDQAIDARILSNTIESAQKRVESANFARRKRVLEYDDVINEQRKLIYGERSRVLNGENIKEHLIKMARSVCDDACDAVLTGDDPQHWDFTMLAASFPGNLLTKEEQNPSDEQRKHLKRESVADLLFDRIQTLYELSEKENTPDIMREVERVVLLRTVDRYWMDHIDAMEELKRGVSLRAYGNRDPVVEYKFEGAEMFDAMISDIKRDTVQQVLFVRVRQDENALQRRAVARISSEGTEEQMSSPGKRKPVVKSAAQKVGPNDPCPCGSGKKYKKCCGNPANKS